MSLEAELFAPYFAGWAKRDLEGAESRLDQLAELHTVSATSLLETTIWLDPTPRGLKRVKQVAPEDLEYTAALLRRWIDRIDLKEFKELLQIISGPNFERTSAAVDLLGSWMYHQKSFDKELSDFAWRCIEHGPSERPTRSAQGWRFDELAAKLTEANPDLGFEKFHQLLLASPSRPSEWKPLYIKDGRKRWWKALRTKDRPRLFDILLEASCANDTTQEDLSWRLKDMLDQDQDADDLLKAVEDKNAHTRIAARWLVGSKPKLLNLAFAFSQEIPARSRASRRSHIGSDGYGNHDSRPWIWLLRSAKAGDSKMVGGSFHADRGAGRGCVTQPKRLVPKSRLTLVWEYDREVNDLKRYIHGNDVDGKRWAIGRNPQIRSMVGCEDAFDGQRKSKKPSPLPHTARAKANRDRATLTYLETCRIASSHRYSVGF